MTVTDPAGVLREGFPGQVLRPGQPGYDEGRQVFNAMIGRRPALIARPANTADVAAAVDAARTHGLVVAVRCGGHSVAGPSTCDDGMLIDLSGLTSLTVDPGARTARAGGGVRWGQFDAAAQAHGLRTPGGRVTTTGIGGFTTGGGCGWTSCKHGLACDNLLFRRGGAGGRPGGARRPARARRPVLGPARRRRRLRHRHRVRVPAAPAGAHRPGGAGPVPRRAGPQVLRGWRDRADTAPDDLATACVLLTAPAGPFVPARLRGRPVLGIAALYAGDAGQGAGVVQPLRDLNPVVDHIAPMPYTAFRAALDPLAPRGFRSYWRGEYLHELTGAAIDTFLDHGAGLTALGAPLSEMVIFRIGQAVAAVPGEATAFCHRDARCLFHPICMWADPADDDRMTAAGRSFASAMRPFSTGGAHLDFTPEADRGIHTGDVLVTARRMLIGPDDKFLRGCRQRGDGHHAVKAVARMGSLLLPYEPTDRAAPVRLCDRDVLRHPSRGVLQLPVRAVGGSVPGPLEGWIDVERLRLWDLGEPWGRRCCLSRGLRSARAGRCSASTSSRV